MQPRKPIYSTREDDPDLREAISDFVIGLAEVVDGLQDLHSSGDFRSLARESRQQAEHAMTYGYPLFAGLADKVARGADAEKAEATEDTLRELSDLVQRIRLAHRGAA
jgi:hypothetical protein